MMTYPMIANDRSNDSHQAARRVIHNYVIAAAVAGALPTPFLSGMATKALQMRMIYLLCKVYGVSFSENLAKGVLLVILAGIAGIAFSRLLNLLIPRITPLGFAANTTAMAIGAGSETYVVGYIVRRHFESGGTLENFDHNVSKGELQQIYRQGQVAARKAVVTRLKPRTATL